MKEVITIGLNLAKNVFRVHGIDGLGRTVIRRQLRRGQMLPFFKKLPPYLVGMEACATSHYWAREITILGHEGRTGASTDQHCTTVTKSRANREPSTDG